jgi:raffinose/stachyose/melibiose transport system permease protein
MCFRIAYQTIIFIPVTLAVLVTGYLWKLLLNPVWSGPFLASLGLHLLVRSWLGDLYGLCVLLTVDRYPHDDVCGCPAKHQRRLL